MIYTTYFAKIKDLPKNVIPISICAKAPSWYGGMEYKKFAPKYEFFMKWKETHDNDYYIKCFKSEVLNKLDYIRVISELQIILPLEIKETMNSPIWINKDYHIALVCYEKPTDFCHRNLVAEWLREKGIECGEYDLNERERNNYDECRRS